MNDEIKITKCEPGYAWGYNATDTPTHLEDVYADTVSVCEPMSISAYIQKVRNVGTVSRSSWKKIRTMENRLATTAYLKDGKNEEAS